MREEEWSGYGPGASFAASERAGDAGLGSEVSTRVKSILDAAEREAEALRAEAREEGRRELEEAKRHADELVAERQRRIAELSDALVERLETLLRGLEGAEDARSAFEDLLRSLGDAAERIGREASAPVERTAPPANPPSELDRSANGAHIVAIQMAAAGRTRGQVESHIRTSLGIAEPSAVLDEVFGEGTPDDATVPWARPRPGEA
jgi:hypothetical protein